MSADEHSEYVVQMFITSSCYEYAGHALQTLNLFNLYSSFAPGFQTDICKRSTAFMYIGVHSVSPNARRIAGKLGVLDLAIVMLIMSHPHMRT